MMNFSVRILNMEPPRFRLREALRYSGADDSFAGITEDCFEECKDLMRYDVCYARMPIIRSDGVLDLTFAKTESRALKKNLESCDEIILFAATVGIGIDRMIARYGALSPSRAVILQGLGAERIESLCDAFCDMLESDEPCGVRPRFSPGYGDLPLEMQREIFTALRPERSIGLTLNENMIMSPSKSVTAIVGIKRCGETDTE